jgi:hypothetical protein
VSYEGWVHRRIEDDLAEALAPSKPAHVLLAAPRFFGKRRILQKIRERLGLFNSVVEFDSVDEGAEVPSLRSLANALLAPIRPGGVDVGTRQDLEDELRRVQVPEGRVLHCVVDGIEYAAQGPGNRLVGALTSVLNGFSPPPLRLILLAQLDLSTAQALLNRSYWYGQLAIRPFGLGELDREQQRALARLVAPDWEEAVTELADRTVGGHPLMLRELMRAAGPEYLERIVKVAPRYDGPLARVLRPLRTRLLNRPKLRTAAKILERRTPSESEVPEHFHELISWSILRPGREPSPTMLEFLRGLPSGPPAA